MNSVIVMCSVISGFAFLHGFLYGRFYQHKKDSEVLKKSMSEIVAGIQENVVNAMVERRDNMFYAYEMDGVFLCQAETFNDIFHAFSNRFPHKILCIVEIEEGALAG